MKAIDAAYWAGQYSAELHRRGYESVRHSEVSFPSTRQALEHAGWMCDQIPGMVEAEREASLGKVMRWLGFVQATLWANGIRSVEQMRGDCRSDSPAT